VPGQIGDIRESVFIAWLLDGRVSGGGMPFAIRWVEYWAGVQATGGSPPKGIACTKTTQPHENQPIANLFIAIVHLFPFSNS
jgi:hypothetical protein